MTYKDLEFRFNEAVEAAEFATEGMADEEFGRLIKSVIETIDEIIALPSSRETLTLKAKAALFTLGGQNGSERDDVLIDQVLRGVCRPN